MGYIYTDDLITMDSYHPYGHMGPLVDLPLLATSTPLNPQAWRTALSQHPDRQFTSYILSGIEDGFQAGLTVTNLFVLPLRTAH